MATEKRLIDAVDLADRVFAIYINAMGMRNGKTILIELLEKYRNEVLRTICSAPTVDAVEVVRCKDCKYNEDCIRRIQFWGRNPVLEINLSEYHPLDFCSYGERKDNG